MIITYSNNILLKILKKTSLYGIGNKYIYYICELIQDFIVEYIFQKETIEIFTNIRWISCIEHFKNNPSVISSFLKELDQTWVINLTCI